MCELGHTLSKKIYQMVAAKLAIEIEVGNRQPRRHPR